MDRLTEPTERNVARRASMHLALIEKLREMVIEGGLVPGERINEMALATRLGVSRTPIREALKVLAADGLVELVPNRGAIVTEISESDLEAHFEVLSVLEGLAGELAAARVTPDELDQIRRHHADMVTAFEAGDLQAYFRFNRAIHDAILAASGNPALLATHRSASGRILAWRFQANLSPARWRAALREHEVILGLLELRQGRELGAVLRAHIMNKLGSLRAHHDGPREPSSS